MKHSFHLSTACLLVAVCLLHSRAEALTANDLRPDAPPCRTPQAKRPKLPVNFEHDDPVEIFADFNGDGWCDYALGVAYPFNSQMNSYTLDQLVLLGGAVGWRRLPRSLHGTVIDLEGLSGDQWPVFQVDLTDIAFVYPKNPGPPYLLGMFAGQLTEGKADVGQASCSQYISVHRWDDTVGAFKRVDDATRDVVLKYFYTAVEKPCPLPQK